MWESCIYIHHACRFLIEGNILLVLRPNSRLPVKAPCTMLFDFFRIHGKLIPYDLFDLEFSDYSIGILYIYNMHSFPIENKMLLLLRTRTFYCLFVCLCVCMRACKCSMVSLSGKTVFHVFSASE